MNFSAIQFDKRGNRLGPFGDTFTSIGEVKSFVKNKAGRHFGPKTAYVQIFENGTLVLSICLDRYAYIFNCSLRKADKFLVDERNVEYWESWESPVSF